MFIRARVHLYYIDITNLKYIKQLFNVKKSILLTFVKKYKVFCFFCCLYEN